MLNMGSAENVMPEAAAAHAEQLAKGLTRGRRRQESGCKHVWARPPRLDGPHAAQWGS